MKFARVNRTYLLLTAIVAALLLLLYFGMNQADYFKVTLMEDELESVTVDLAANGNLAEDGRMDGGEWLQSERYMLEAGEYRIACDYTLESGNVRMLVVDDLAADPDNHPATLLAAQVLTPEQTRTEITVTLDRLSHGIRVLYQAGDAAFVPTFTHIESTHRVWRDTAFLLLLCAALFALFLWMHHRESRRVSLEQERFAVRGSGVFLLCLMAAFVATLPAMRSFFAYGHDIHFHITRIEGIKDGILAGQFPVRINPTFTNGYGYIAPIMYPDLFLYLPALLRLCGVSWFLSYQVFIFFINLATALVAYACITRLTGKKTLGVMISLLYTLSMYRMICLYTRAAIGEALALLFFPCVVLGMVEVLKRGRLSKWLIIGLTGLIQSHIISVLIAAYGCATLTAVFIASRKTSWRNLLLLLGHAGAVLLLNLWFLVPFTVHSQLLDFGIYYDPREMFNYALYPSQMFASFVMPYGMTWRLGKTANEMPLSVGLLLGLGMVLFLFSEFIMRNREREDAGLRRLNRTSFTFAVFTLFISSVYFPWHYVYKVPLLGELIYAAQFPWRYLGVATIALCIVFAVSAYRLVPQAKYHRALILLCALLAIANIAPFSDQIMQSDMQIIAIKDKFTPFSTNELQTGDYYDKDTDFPAYLARPLVLKASADGAAFSNVSKAYTNVSFDYRLPPDGGEAVSVEVPLYAYPGYEALWNGEEELAVQSGGNGILTVALPDGATEGSVSVRYRGFWYFVVCDLISLAAGMGFIAWYIVRKLKQRAIRS